MAKFCVKCGTALDGSGKCLKCDAFIEAPKTEKREKFCTKCGGENDATGKCPKCSGGIEMPKTEPAKEPKKTAGKVKKAFKITMIVLSVYTALLLVFGTLTFFNVVKIPFLNDAFVFMGWKEEQVEETPVATNSTEENGGSEPVDDGTDSGREDYTPGFKDADEYFRNNASVKDEIYAKDSQTVRTEAETVEDLSARGFTQNSIYTSYDMDGNYTDEIAASGYSSSSHPMYRTLYVTPQGVTWQVFAINGEVMASRFADDMTKGFLVSEKPTITSYDNIKNKFYVNTPNSSLADVKVVSRVDAQTLDSLH